MIVSQGCMGPSNLMSTFGKYLRWNISLGFCEEQTVFFTVVSQISRCVNQTKKLRNNEVLNFNFKLGVQISVQLEHFEIHIWLTGKTIFPEKAPNEIFQQKRFLNVHIKLVNLMYLNLLEFFCFLRVQARCDHFYELISLILDVGQSGFCVRVKCVCVK